MTIGITQYKSWSNDVESGIDVHRVRVDKAHRVNAYALFS